MSRLIDRVSREKRKQTTGVKKGEGDKGELL